MKFKIIVDSSSNLLNSYYQDKKDVAFKVVPLTIRIGQEEFIDNDELKDIFSQTLMEKVGL